MIQIESSSVVLSALEYSRLQELADMSGQILTELSHCTQGELTNEQMVHDIREVTRFYSFPHARLIKALSS